MAKLDLVTITEFHLSLSAVLPDVSFKGDIGLVVCASEYHTNVLLVTKFLQWNFDFRCWFTSTAIEIMYWKDLKRITTYPIACTTAVDAVHAMLKRTSVIVM